MIRMDPSSDTAIPGLDPDLSTLADFHGDD